MIVTHTRNPQGHRRVYLGGKGSIACWIEPAADGIAWSFHIDTAAAAYPLSDDTLRQMAARQLLELADMVGAAPHELKAVPFETIAALHTANPNDSGRAPAPRAQAYAHAFVTMPPNITQPGAPFTGERDTRHYRRR